MRASGRLSALHDQEHEIADIRSYKEETLPPVEDAFFAREHYDKQGKAGEYGNADVDIAFRLQRDRPY